MSEWHIPGYEVLEEVARGGMAVIWKARQLSLDRIVALKVLNPGLIRDAEEITRFQEEARAAAQLRHPGLARIYDAGESGGQVYYVMEYIEGRTVGDRLVREGPIPEEEALRIVDEAAAILDALWQRDKVIHCDIKPDNILIDKEGRVRIADMGLAQAIGQASKSLDRGLIIGTPNYASPEQAQGEGDLDCRTDIYGMGATLYHMLTGHLPFAERVGLDAMVEQISGFLPDPQSFQSDITNGAAWMMEKMLIKDRAHRYQTWDEVRRDLAEVRQGRLPLGRLPSEGMSTLIRTTEREHATLLQFHAARARPAARTPGVAPGAGGKKKVVVVPKKARTLTEKKPSRRPEDTQKAISMMLFLLILVAGLYGATFYGLHRLTLTDAERDPAVAPDPVDEFVRVAPPREPVEPTLRPPAPEVRPPEESRLDWDHPRYVEGMRLLREAETRYQAFIESRDPALLDEVEPKCRRAIELFESVRREAPPAAQIDDWIRECFQLIAQSRQMRLLESREEPLPREPLVPRRPPNNLQLAENWNTPVPNRVVIVHELNHLLAAHGQSEIDLAPKPDIRLYEQIPYLVHVEEALRWLGDARASRRPVMCPGFPENSLFYYKIAGQYRDGFDRLLLVTDVRDQVVAVQLMSETPRETAWLNADRFEGRWRTYNFIQTRTKPHADWKIGYQVEAGSDVVRVDSELIDPSGASGRSRARASLYMPQPLVNLILHRLNS